MNALQQALGRLVLLQDAVGEADLERAGLLLDELGDDLRDLGRDLARPREVDHCCAVCETTCDEVTSLKRAVRELQGQGLLLAHALHESRDLTATARAMINEKFPPEERAA